MTIYGWDMSHYDAPSIGYAVAEGISFITHKAGGDANDAELGQWWNGVKGLPESVVLGAYWVQYPGNPAGRADAFLARLDSQCPGWRSRDAFILQIDAEIWGGNTATRPSLAEINAFADRLRDRTGGKYVPVAYAPKWVYGNVAGLRYPLWASSYVGGSGGFKGLYPGDDSSRWTGYGKPVTILQYSSSATIGGQSTSDANAFRGTVAELKNLVTPASPTEDKEMTLADEQITITTSSAPLFTAGSKSAPASEFLALSAIYAYRANAAAASAGKAIAALANTVAGLDTVDEVALGAAIQEGLVPAISASVTTGVVAALADADVDLTPEMIQEKVEAGIREVLGGLDAVPTA